MVRLKTQNIIKIVLLLLMISLIILLYSRIYNPKKNIWDAVYNSDYKLAYDLLQKYPEQSNFIRTDPPFPERISVLQIAISHNEKEIINELLKAGANVNFQNHDGHTPLHYASNKPDIISILLKYKANPNIKDNNGDTPLHSATNIPEEMEMLLKHGANPNIKNDEGISPFRKTCKESNINMLKMCIEHGALVREEQILRYWFLGLKESRSNNFNERLSILELLLNKGALIDVYFFNGIRSSDKLSDKQKRQIFDTIYKSMKEWE